MRAVTAEQMTDAVREWAKTKDKSSSYPGPSPPEDQLNRLLALLESKEMIVKGHPKRIHKAEEPGWLVETTKCPFDGNHPGRFYIYDEGGAGFKCWRCTDKHWVDIEMLWGVRWHQPFAVTANGDLLTLTWLTDLDRFLKEPVPDMTIYMEQEGCPILFDGSLHEIYSYRGVGKSILSNRMVGLLVHGGEWLRFKSAGGFKVAIVDVELTCRQLVNRLESTIGESHGLVRLMTPEKLGGRFPNLSHTAYQQKLVEELRDFCAQVLIIDSLTAGFRINTNDPGQIAAANDFLRELKIKHGLCTVVLHHAGKNETQRGRTDIEDHLETVIKLSSMPDAQPGELRVRLEYEKRRELGIVHNFCFEVKGGQWTEILDPKAAEISGLLLHGKSYRTIERTLNVSAKTIAMVKRTAEQNGVVFPPPGSIKSKKGPKNTGKRSGAHK